MGLFQRLALAILDRPDPAARSTGIRYTFTGYDYAKAKSAAKRAQSRTETGRVIPRPKAHQPARVTPFPKVSGQ